jgi:hypothetical protein
LERGFAPPSQVQRFLREGFVNYFVFDGELAENMLSAERNDAESVLEDLFELRILGKLKDLANEYWEEKSSGKASEDKGLTRRKNRVSLLRARINELSKERSKVEKVAEQERRALIRRQADFEVALAQTRREQDSIQEARASSTAAEELVRTRSDSLLALLRAPHALSTKFADEMLALKESFDKVKLPESASREWFEELAREVECVCGRQLDDGTRVAIRERAHQYLGTDDVALLNSIKSAVVTQLLPDPHQAHREFSEAVNQLRSNVTAAGEAKTKLDAVLTGALSESPDLQKAKAEIDRRTIALRELEARLEKFDDPDDARNDESTYGIVVLQRRLKDAERKLAEITETLTLKAKRDVLIRILDSAHAAARAELASAVVKATNARIVDLMPNNRIRVESIERSLRLENQDGASVGETLSVGYAFLATLFNRAEHVLPFVVDSPANPIDLKVRKQVAKLVPLLTSQFIGFTISSEREGFIKPLEEASKNGIQFLTLFRKGPADVERAAKAERGVIETEDGLLVPGRRFFDAFQLDEERV